MMPSIEYQLLAPCIIVFGAAVLGVVIEALVSGELRLKAQILFSGAAIAVAVIITVRNWWSGTAQTITAMGSLAIDGPAMAAWVLLLLGTGSVLIVAADRASNDGLSAFASQASATPGSAEEEAAKARGAEHTEVFPLTLFALSGMMVVVSASNLIMVFVGLEVMSLPLYLLVGLARHNRILSHDAALKYFLLGATASAVFLYGIALLFGATGAMGYAEIALAVPDTPAHDPLLYAGMALTAVGLLFKLGVFPFHSWVPDIFDGAPAAIAAFLATSGKVAAVFALLRLFFVPLGALRWTWQLPMAGVALCSIAFGAIGGLTQQNIKRLLAYSSIMHAGFMLLPIAAASAAPNGMLVSDLGSVGALLFYLVSYLPATLGAFVLTQWVRARGGPAAELSDWRGLIHRNPFAALSMAVFMLSLIGIPGTSGFFAKLMSLVLVWRNGFSWLALGGLVCSLVAAAFYLRVIRVMFMEAPSTMETEEPPSKALMALVIVCMALVVYCGVFPEQASDVLVDLAGLLR